MQYRHRISANRFTHGFFALCIVWFACAHAKAIGWDDDDFLIAGFNSNTIGVYDSDLTFKGNLVSDFNFVTGLDFDAVGNVVAAGRLPGQVRVVSPAGIQLSSFDNNDLGAPFDLKVGPNGNYYVAPLSFAGSGLREFTPAGTTGRTFGTGLYSSVAVLPGGTLWGSGGQPQAGISVFDLSSGDDVATIAFDNGQFDASSMSYSAATDTVLMVDTLFGVFERQTDGQFVRSFTADGLGRPTGITSGPNGDVLVTDEDDNGVYRWHADGTFVSFTPLGGGLASPINILWTGNSQAIIPEPASVISCVGLLSLIGLRRRANVHKLTIRGALPRTRLELS